MSDQIIPEKEEPAQMNESKTKALDDMFDRYRLNLLNVIPSSVLVECCTSLMDISGLINDCRRVNESKEEAAKANLDVKGMTVAMCNKFASVILSLCKRTGAHMPHFIGAYEVGQLIKRQMDAAVAAKKPNDEIAKLEIQYGEVMFVSDLFDTLFANFEKNGHVLYPFVGGNHEFLAGAYHNLSGADFQLKLVVKLFEEIKKLPAFEEEKMELVTSRFEVLKKAYAFDSAAVIDPTFNPSIPNAEIVSEIPEDMLTEEFKATVARHRIKTRLGDFEEPSSGTARLGTRVVEADVHYLTAVLVLLLSDYRVSNRPEHVERRKKEAEELKKASPQPEPEPEKKSVAEKKAEKNKKKKASAKKAKGVKQEGESSSASKKEEPVKSEELVPIPNSLLSTRELIDLVANTITKQKEREDATDKHVDTFRLMNTLCLVYSKNKERRIVASPLVQEIDALNQQLYGEQNVKKEENNAQNQ